MRDAEHGADQARRTLAEGLQKVLVPPLEPEELYTMSERLDVVMNRAKSVVRDSEAVGWHPDAVAAAMATALLEGTEHLAAAVGCIRGDAARRAGAPMTRPTACERPRRRIAPRWSRRRT